ncbi:MAG TPA: hypothetical protein VGM31_02875 [Puia sp.]|jgi:uncharacterized membrane protein
MTKLENPRHLLQKEMKPLIVLVASFLICFLILRLSNGWWDYRLSARIAMAIMLLFTAAAHFVFTKGMVMMLPAFVPLKNVLVYLTGVAEAAAAVGLLRDAWFANTGVLLILLFMAMLPANVYAAIHHIDYKKGDAGGKGPSYLWFRVPLQFFFVAWVYFLILY